MTLLRHFNVPSCDKLAIQCLAKDYILFLALFICYLLTLAASAVFWE